MGRIGPKPEPTQLKIIKGNPGHRPLPKNEPKPKLAIPPCPDWLSINAQKIYWRIAEILMNSKTITVADGIALAMLSDSWAEFIEMRKYIQENGPTYSIDGRNGHQVKARPEVKIAADAWRRARQLLPEFGLTPSARSRIEALPDEEKNDPLAELLGGGNGQG